MLVLTLNLTSLDTTGNVLSVVTDNNNRGGGLDAWGITLGESGALNFGRVTFNNLAIADNSVSLGTLTTGVDYTITIVSTGQKSSGDVVGRGTQNFKITVADGVTTNSYTGAGFGLNGDSFERLSIGSTNGVQGTLGVVAYIPEPATATLSLLALAGLAARRRRR